MPVDDPLRMIALVSHSGRAALPLTAATAPRNDRKGVLPSGRFSRVTDYSRSG